MTAVWGEVQEAKGGCIEMVTTMSKGRGLLGRVVT